MVSGAMTDWGAEIRRLRQTRFLKQSALAEALNVDQATVSRWERNLTVPERGAQRRLREMMRQPGLDDFLLRHVVTVAQGQILLSNIERIMQVLSVSYSAAHGLPMTAMVGYSTRGMYTAEGEALWQESRRSGFYRGDVASVTAITRANSLSGHRRNIPIKVVWVPTRLVSGEIFLRAERTVLPENELAPQVTANGGPIRVVTMDELVG